MKNFFQSIAWYYYQKYSGFEDGSPEKERFLHDFGLKWSRWFDSSKIQQPFFVISTPRTGSNLLTDYLNRLSGVTCWGEILSIYRVMEGLPGHYGNASAMRHLSESLHAMQSPICGAKLMVTHFYDFSLSPKDILALYPNAKFILLYRESLEEQIVSLMTMLRTQKASLATSDLVFQAPPALTQYLAFVLREQTEWMFQQTELRDRSLILSYESLAQNAQQVFDQQLAPFLGFAPQPLQTRMVKQNTRPIRQVVENYEEAFSFLTQEARRQSYTLDDFDRFSQEKGKIISYA